jgi:hypothetical protein
LFYHEKKITNFTVFLKEIRIFAHAHQVIQAKDAKIAIHVIQTLAKTVNFHSFYNANLLFFLIIFCFKIGGQCVPQAGGTCYCQCPQGYSGQFCENAVVNPCMPNPCNF